MDSFVKLVEQLQENDRISSLGDRLSGMPRRDASLSPEVLAALSALDDRLAFVFGRGDIRLVRSAWVLVQDPTGFCIPHRQALEAMEKSGVSPSPLLSPQEAEALLRRGQRCVGVLSQYVPHRCFQPGTVVHRCGHSLLLLLLQLTASAFASHR